MNNSIPVIYKDNEKQKWFESLTKINRNNIPSNLVAKSELIKLGLSVDESKAVAWAYQQFTHLPYLLYDIESYKEGK